MLSSQAEQWDHGWCIPANLQISIAIRHTALILFAVTSYIVITNYV